MTTSLSYYYYESNDIYLMNLKSLGRADLPVESTSCLIRIGRVFAEISSCKDDRNFLTIYSIAHSELFFVRTR